MSQTYATESYVNDLFRKGRVEEAQRKIKTAIHNPVTGYVHLEDPAYGSAEHADRIPWENYPKVLNATRYQELKAKNASGQRHANDDQAQYNFYTPEWQDEALRCNEFIESHGAGVTTSTDYPAITVTTVQNELLRLDVIAASKYNLLGIPQVQNTDQLLVSFPEYNDTGKKVRTGYKENDPIDTVSAGAFTETRIGLDKAGVGIAFTEEFYMRKYTYDIGSILLETIAIDFARVKHERILALLPSFADLTGADWAAYTAGNLQSTNRPSTDLNAAKSAINADKVARVNTIVSNEAQWIAYDVNTWTREYGQALTASDRNQNDVIVNPRGIPWAQRWIISEDIANDKAFVFDSNAFYTIQGPRKTTQYQIYNPDQTVTIQKDWFKQHLRKSSWGRELVSI